MSSIGHGRVIISLLLLCFICSYVEAQVYYSREGYYYRDFRDRRPARHYHNYAYKPSNNNGNRRMRMHTGQGQGQGRRKNGVEPSPGVTNTIGNMPPETQQKLFKTLMSERKVTVRDQAPKKAVKQLPHLIAAIAEGIAGPYLAGLPPGVGGLLGSLISGGLDALMSVFSKEKEPPPPNMPPVITCPKSITRFQDPGMKSAVVTWPEPVAYDVEDGRLSRIEQTDGAVSGSLFLGEEIIKYRVKDREGRKDTCSFYVTVKLIKCPPIPLTQHLSSNCTFGSYLGDVCTASCDDGYTLLGASHLTCTENEVYDEYAPTCKAITCPEPDLPVGGNGWDCSDSNNFESVCSLNCSAGFRIVSDRRAPWNVASIKCQADGNWTAMPSCKDIAAPTIENCPGYTMKYADRGRNSTVVTWPEIIGTDRNGGNVSVVQTIGHPSGSRFEVGAHEIGYEVTDNAQLKDTCAFYINVHMRSCHAPPITHERLNINCHGQFTHGSACTVTCRHGIQLQGAPRITCEAVNNNMTWSMPGGTPTCLVKECAKLEHPPNARRDCSKLAGRTVCFVKCRRDYIPARNVKVMTPSTCSESTGIWRNEHHPGCVRKRSPTSLQSNLRFYWKLRPRCDDSDLGNVTATFQNILSREDFRSRCPQCRVKDVRTYCTEKSRYNVITVRWSVVHDLQDESTMEIIQKDIESVGVRMKNWLRVNFRFLRVVGAARKVPFRFKGSANTIGCAGEYAPDQAERACAACAPGYEFDGVASCQICPAGSYQDDSGNLRCKACTEGRQTTGPGKTRAIDCKAPCPKGSSSSTGLTPCWTCPIGTYQPKKRSSKCEPCPDGYVTATNGSHNATDCYAPAAQVNRMRSLRTGDTYIKLRWMRPRELNGILVGHDIAYYKASDNIRSRVFLNVRNNRTYSKEITGLEPATEYIFTVWAVTESGRGLEKSLTITTLNSSDVTTTPVVPTTADPTLCPPGTNSPDGKRYEDGTCTPCSKNFYQNETGQTSCIVCAPGYVTWFEGSTSENDCVDSTWTTPTTTTTTTAAPTTTTGPLEPCGPGEVSQSGFQPGCTQCPPNKIPNKRRKKCKWCGQGKRGRPVCPTLLNTTPMTTVGIEETTEANDVALSPDDANRTDRGEIDISLSDIDVA